MNKKLWFSITAKDCEFKAKRGSGNGGQKRNKTSNAIQCTHVASGATGEAEDSKSQKINKRNAFQRMTETKEFKGWLELKIQAGLGNVEIQEGESLPRKLSKEEI